MDSSSSDGEEEDYNRCAKLCCLGCYFISRVVLLQYSKKINSYELHDLAENGESALLGEVIGIGQEHTQPHVHTLLQSPEYGPHSQTFQVNLDVKDRDFCTPLHCALFGCQLGTARMLLRAGANVNLPVEGNPPLHIALAMGGLEKNRDFSLKAVDMLLEFNADFAIKDDKRRTALHVAVCADNSSNTSPSLWHIQALLDLPDCATTLLKVAGESAVVLVMTKDKRHRLPLHLACAHMGSSSEALLQLLLAAGGQKMQLAAMDEDGNSPLHICAHYDNEVEGGGGVFCVYCALKGSTQR
jgi:hypothetical protein